MDIKHVLHCNPTDPVVHERRRTRRPRRTPLCVRRRARRQRRDRPRRRRVLLRQRAARATSCTSSRCRSPNRLVCAGEWLEFIADDGYRRPELWLSDGWYAVQEQRLGRAALLARRRRRRLERVHARRAAAPLDPNEPVVHVSHYEADAYARWRDARLPTEFEWEHAVACSPPGTLRRDRRRRLAVDVERVPPVPALSARGRRGR